ncbi:hypothetical protein [Actinomadura rudentiformis]|uniref:Uncharacterized protein n=1 Tax=Actinomadura rudentiformis TaxID=359158 RepID=A0A6H9Z775_9ACTN|nr:hypothetical protein [Actinomadura rudentiformis]KAB2349655.1 hypothetical protein F8566_12935 [Actinomadura rudentiformis]
MTSRIDALLTSTAALRDHELGCDASDEGAQVLLKAIIAEPPVAPSTGRPRSRRRRAIVAGGLALATVPLLGFSYLHVESEYVDRLPTENALVHGKAGRDEYWLVPSFHKDTCQRPESGVELVSKRRNILGAEWDTAGVGQRRSGCPAGEVTFDRAGEADLLATRLGNRNDPERAWAVIGAFHPDVRTVRVITSGKPRSASTLPRADNPNGPRYIALTLPASTTFASLTYLDERGRQIPGGTRQLILRTPPD